MFLCMEYHWNTKLKYKTFYFSFYKVLATLTKPVTQTLYLWYQIRIDSVLHIIPTLTPPLHNTNHQQMIKWRSVQNFNRDMHIPFWTTTIYSLAVLHNNTLNLRTWCSLFLIPLYNIGTTEMNVCRQSDFCCCPPPMSIFQSGPLHPITTDPKSHPRWHHDWKSWPECLKSGSDRRRYLPTLRSAESTGCMHVMERRKYYSQIPVSLEECMSLGKHSTNLYLNITVVLKNYLYGLGYTVSRNRNCEQKLQKSSLKNSQHATNSNSKLNSNSTEKQRL